MLMTMKAKNEAMRALAYVVAMHLDLARHHSRPAIRQTHQARVDLLIPVVKGWSTEIGIEIASLGVQVHGGMGYVEESGACQHLRDARITTIYEGTTGIQAADLAGRKLNMDKGAAMRTLIAEIEATAETLDPIPGDDMAVIRDGLRDGVRALTEATERMLSCGDPNQDDGGIGGLYDAGRHRLRWLANGSRRASGPEQADDRRGFAVP
jgi:hypothetical protein